MQTGMQIDVAACWELNEASGSVIDATGNGHTGTIVGNDIRGETGKIGDCYLFDGATRVEVPHSSDLAISGDFTAGCWLYIPASSASVQTFLGKPVEEGAHNSPYYDYSIQAINIGASTAYIRCCMSDGTAFRYPAYTASVDAWHHVVLVYDSTAGYLKCYVDGTYRSQTAITTGENDNEQDLFFGCNGLYAEDSESYQDQMFIAQRAFSVDDISAIYNSGNGLAYADWADENTVEIEKLSGLASLKTLAVKRVVTTELVNQSVSGTVLDISVKRIVNHTLSALVAEGVISDLDVKRIINSELITLLSTASVNSVDVKRIINNDLATLLSTVFVNSISAKIGILELLTLAINVTLSEISVKRIINHELSTLVGEGVISDLDVKRIINSELATLLSTVFVNSVSAKKVINTLIGSLSVGSTVSQLEVKRIITEKLALLSAELPMNSLGTGILRFLSDDSLIHSYPYISGHSELYDKINLKSYV